MVSLSKGHSVDTISMEMNWKHAFFAAEIRILRQIQLATQQTKAVLGLTERGERLAMVRHRRKIDDHLNEG